jgi:hypothetical protein
MNASLKPMVKKNCPALLAKPGRLPSYAASRRPSCDVQHRRQCRALATCVTLSVGIGAMDNDANRLAELDDEILAFDVPDDALERAAAVSDGQAAHTIGYCTHWYQCNWPL